MKKKIFLFLFLLCFGLAGAQNTWIQKNSIPGLVRFGAVGFSIGTKGYISTGAGPGGNNLDDLWEFEPVSNTWTQKASFPAGGRYFSAAFSSLTKGYVGTGGSAGGYLADLWEYDPSSNSWTAKANIGGGGRCCSSAFNIGDHMYLGTGVNSSNVYLNDFWKFAPSTNSWTQKASVPGSGRALAVGFSIGDKGYLGTGAPTSGVGTSDIWQYDTTANSWTQMANLPGGGMSECVGFSIGNFGYIGLGTPIWGSGCTDNFLKFDPAGNSWTAVATFPGGIREEAVAFVIGCKAYVGTGFIDDNYNTAQNDLWEYTPDSNVCNTLALFSAPNHICPGTCINFTNLSSNVTSSYWSFPGANPNTSYDTNPQNICYLNSGNYDVQLIVVSASGSDTLLLTNYITVYPSPPPQGIAQNGDTLFANPGSAFYQWYYNGNAIPGGTNYFYVAPQSGDYNVVATDINGCEVEAVINNVLANTTPQSTVGDEQLAIFPNPVAETLTVTRYPLSGTAVEIAIYNWVGERVIIQESRVKSQEEIIDVSKLRSGIYYLEVISGEKIYRSKFVKL